MSILTKEEIETSVLLGELIPMYHACGGIAFYTTVRWTMGDDIIAANVIRLDGTHPIDMVDYIECGSCGDRPMGTTISMEEFFYK